MSVVQRRTRAAELTAWCAFCLAVGLAAPVAAQGATCPMRTGEDATVVVPRDALEPEDLTAGDVLRAYDGDGDCLGETVWPDAGGAALTLWGDNTETAERDGAMPGEAFLLRAVREGQEVALSVSFEEVLAAPEGTGAEYHPGAIYIVEELVVQAPPAPEVALTMSTEEEPVIVVADGGSISFSVSVVNPTATTQVVNAWSRAVREDGQMTRVLLGPVTVSLAPGATVSRELRQPVGSQAMAGDWVYTGYIGTFPGGATDSSSIRVIKEGGAGQRTSDVSAGWATAVYGPGEERAGEEIVAGELWAEYTPGAGGAPEAHQLHAPRPNPASSRSTLAFELAEASRVNIAVYDLLGRRVAVLTDDHFKAGRYETVLEGQQLPSGTYLACMRVVGGNTAFVQTRRVTLVR